VFTSSGSRSDAFKSVILIQTENKTCRGGAVLSRPPDYGKNDLSRGQVSACLVSPGRQHS